MDSSLVQNVLEGIFSTTFLAAVLRVTTPILLPSLGALISDRAGVINIGLEGTMLIAAFTGVAFSAYAQNWFGTYSSDTVVVALLVMLGLLVLIAAFVWLLHLKNMLLRFLAGLSLLLAVLIVYVLIAFELDWLDLTLTGERIGPWLGLIMGVLMGILAALLLGFFHLRLKANLILSGIALNFLGQAGTVAVMFELTGNRGNTKGSLDSLKMPFIQLPEFLNDIEIAGRNIPVINPVVSFFFHIFDNQSVMTWIAFLAVPLVWYLMYRTPVGIHMRAVGQNPDAAASVGIRVQRIRYLALVLSGILAALGGIHMSMGYLTFFQDNMTAGRGFIALATPYLGGGHPVGTGFAAMVFGSFDALSNRVGTLEIPSMLPQMLPYMATVMALVIYALQNQLTVRVRTLRSAEGEQFDAAFWRAIQRLSVLHMFMAMLAVFGVVACVSMFSAPDGFKTLGEEWDEMDVRLYGGAIGLLSLALIAINLPFMLDVERIGRRVIYSAAASIVSLWLYLGLLFMLFLRTTALENSAGWVGFAAGLVAGTVVWALLGGQHLSRNVRQQIPAAA
jgi:simple sugar transport system permease protein